MTVTVMALIYLERKFVGRIQMRLGPMRTGPYGTLQSIADAMKLLTKEDLRPATADFWLFELAPYVTFVPVFMTLLALPFMRGLGRARPAAGPVLHRRRLRRDVIGYIMAGWASDNKYALLGAVRSAAQLISYEIPLILARAGRLDGRRLAEPERHHVAQDTVPNIVLQPLPFLILLTATLAELSRRPFDIPIGESELVGGPWVEYSGIRWSIIFALTEYAGLWGMPSWLAGVPRRLGVPLGSDAGLVSTSCPDVRQVVLPHPDNDVDQRHVPAPAHRPADGFCWKILLPSASFK